VSAHRSNFGFRIARFGTFMGCVRAEESSRHVVSPLAVAVGTRRARHELMASEATTVADLAEAIGRSRADALWIDGVRREPSILLIDASVRVGSTVEHDVSEHGDVEDNAQAAASVSCIAGPATGRSVGLAPGRHVVGRGPAADVRLADPWLEPHALALDVSTGGQTTMTQLTGRAPAMIGGEPVDGTMAWTPGSAVHVGASRLEIRIPDEPLARRRWPAGAQRSPLSPWRRIRVGVGGRRQHSPPFDVTAALDAVRSGDILWSQDAVSDGAFQATLGWGPVDRDPTVASDVGGGWISGPTAGDSPIVVDAGPGARIGVVAADRRDRCGAARAILLQLAAAAGPAEWSLVVVTDDPARWVWCEWLPHLLACISADELDARADPRPVSVDDVDDGRHVVVVADEGAAGAAERAFRSRIGSPWPDIALVELGEVQPPGRRGPLLEIGTRCRGRWLAGSGSVTAQAIHVALLTHDDALTAALVLAALEPRVRGT
jgi:hypothetical protein